MQNQRSIADARLLRSLQPCICGAGRRYIRRMTSIDGTEIGIICLKCERFTLGDNLEQCVVYWNKRRLGD